MTNSDRKKKEYVKTKVSFYNKILEGKSVKVTNEAELEALRISQDWILSTAFGYTPDELSQMPENHYNDYLLLENLQSQKEKARAEAEKAKHEREKRRR